MLFYGDYTKFSVETFIRLQVKLNTLSISTNEKGFLNFCKIFRETLNKDAPCKLKTMRKNQRPYINQDTSRAIMKELNFVTNFWNTNQSKVGKHLPSNVIIVPLIYENWKGIITAILMWMTLQTIRNSGER